VVGRVRVDAGDPVGEATEKMLTTVQRFHWSGKRPADRTTPTTGWRVETIDTVHTPTKLLPSVVLLLVLAACGDDGNDAPTSAPVVAPTSPTMTTEPGTTSASPTTTTTEPTVSVEQIASTIAAVRSSTKPRSTASSRQRRRNNRPERPTILPTIAAG
jgi:hypothetical protein